jgi:TonB family protein
MTKKNNLPLIALLILCVVLLSYLSTNSNRAQKVRAQNQPQTQTFKLDPEKINVPLVDGKLRIRLSQEFEQFSWLIGVQVDNSNAGTISALSANLGKGAQPFVKSFNSIKNWPQELIQAQQGSVSIAAKSAKDGLLVYVAMPSGKQIQVDIGEKTVCLTQVRQDLVIDPSGVTVAQVKGVSGLVMRSIIPASSSNDSLPEVISDQGKKNIASPKGIKSHLISFVKPDMPAQVAVDKLETVVLKISIDEQGQVKDVVKLIGQEPYASASEKAVRQWRFKPFELEGKKVEVSASIPFHFSSNGTVGSLVFN